MYNDNTKSRWDFNHGYDWAAGQLLRGDSSPEFIADELRGYKSDQLFVQGAIDAVERFGELNLLRKSVCK